MSLTDDGQSSISAEACEHLSFAAVLYHQADKFFLMSLVIVLRLLLSIVLPQVYQVRPCLFKSDCSLYC